MYDVWAKAENTRLAQHDFEQLYGKHVTPFTRKQYFYFIVDGGKKYVHKHSLRYIYSNRDTFVMDEGLNYCRLAKEFEPIDIIHILETRQLAFMPQLIESNEHFLVYDYVSGTLMQSLTNSDYYECKQIHSQSPLTPFYNSINDNLIKTNDGIKLIDFKQLDPVDRDQPFYVYLRNPLATELHVDVGVDVSDIVKYIEEEFVAYNLTIVRHQ